MEAKTINSPCDLEGSLAFKRQVERKAFIWNTASGLLMAFQSVIMLMVIMRVCDVVDAGIFTIAYANANLFLNIGKYGMRQFQVSDRVPQFSFADYASSRIVTTLLMLVVGCIYLFITNMLFGYSTDKNIVILVMYVFKAVDSMEDIYHGNYQQYGRLDVGARVLTFRLLTTLIVFTVSTIATSSLVLGMVLATAFTSVFYVSETLYIKKRYSLPKGFYPFSMRALWGLLKACFPLFVAAFLLFYIGNAPKYAIDASMDDVAQAYFGFIAMPVFVVSLLSSFVYNPMIASLADTWNRLETRRFLTRFGMIGVVIVVISVVCGLLAWFLGVPVLNWLYHTEVGDYRNELTILVVGGGFLAIASLATLGIAIIRTQKTLLFGYVAVAILALVASSWAVGEWGITGASWVYFYSMLLLALITIIIFIIGSIVRSNKLRSLSS